MYIIGSNERDKMNNITITVGTDKTSIFAHQGDNELRHFFIAREGDLFVNNFDKIESDRIFDVNVADQLQAMRSGIEQLMIEMGRAQ